MVNTIMQECEGSKEIHQKLNSRPILKKMHHKALPSSHGEPSFWTDFSTGGPFSQFEMCQEND